MRRIYGSLLILTIKVLKFAIEQMYRMKKGKYRVKDTISFVADAKKLS